MSCAADHTLEHAFSLRTGADAGHGAVLEGRGKRFASWGPQHLHSKLVHQARTRPEVGGMRRAAWSPSTMKH